MAADEHLRRSFDRLAARLREDISRQLDAIGSELGASLNEEQSQAAAAAEEERVRALADAAEEHEESLDRARQAAREEAERDTVERLTAARSEERDLARVEALELARAEREAAGLADHLRLLEAIRAIDRAKSLSEILDTLAGCAGREAARVGVLIVRGSQLRGWRFVGFGSPLDDTSDFETPMADAGIIGDAVRTGVAASGDSAAHASAPAFAALPAGRETLALPVPMSGQIVAVLYADQGPSTSPGAGDRQRGMAWPAALEVMTRHAARCLEAITASRAAQVLTERPDVASSHGSPALATPTDAAEDEQSARRYARLLISEIKLYHEPEVVAGRRDGNLADRLGGEIARARVLYEQRVPAQVRQRGDFFQDELVRTLADGDAALLARI
ncbi:MAG TPA: hypothetical protein VHZ73_01810 [Vicinamibacterales bacterium]|jgi:hypothetical protein|nr:hypothetical protein [Vicinamibacterales bacterium]